jgi:hypothetical protein
MTAARCTAAPCTAVPSLLTTITADRCGGYYMSIARPM